jgi:hypothetical protein
MSRNVENGTSRTTTTQKHLEASEWEGGADMTPQAHGFGATLEQASARLQAVMAVVLTTGLLTAVVTDGMVPALVTKALLAAMVVPTVMVALALTQSRPKPEVRDQLQVLRGESLEWESPLEIAA